MLPLYPAAFSLELHSCCRGGLHTCSQTLLIPGFKKRSYKTTTQRGGSSHASREPPRSQRLSVYPTPDLHSFSYFHPTLLLMDAEGCWVRRSTKISFRDQDKLNWFPARPAQRWVTPQIQLLICPLYSLSSHPQRKKKIKQRCTKECRILSVLLPARNTSRVVSSAARTRALLFSVGKG